MYLSSVNFAIKGAFRLKFGETLRTLHVLYEICRFEINLLISMHLVFDGMNKMKLTGRLFLINAQLVVVFYIVCCTLAKK